MQFFLLAIWLFTYSPNSYIFTHFIYTLNDVRAHSYNFYTRSTSHKQNSIHIPMLCTKYHKKRSLHNKTGAEARWKDTEWKKGKLEVLCFYRNTQTKPNKNIKRKQEFTHKSQRSNKSDELDKIIRSELTMKKKSKQKIIRRRKQNFDYFFFWSKRNRQKKKTSYVEKWKFATA